MSLALYRKYRSKSLDEIVGQDHITGMLQRAIAKDKIAHAYLLTGPKGVGKTSIARILAHQINELPYTEESQHLDIIEIDAASNNSVEDVRDLRERVQIAPSSARRKVYIIDEVHMLSKQAFNALLKTLEEPPAHIVFILATTDADKLPATIISRVQRFNFRAISEADATHHLAHIAQQEGIAAEPDALALIAAHGKGSFRDSIGLLDQMQNLAEGAITRDMVASILGLMDSTLVEQLLQSYIIGDIKTTVKLLDDAEKTGAPPLVITEQLIRHIRRNITTEPQFLPLLQSLLEVPKSAWPEVRLLTALAAEYQAVNQNPPARHPELDSGSSASGSSSWIPGQARNDKDAEDSSGRKAETASLKSLSPSAPLDNADKRVMRGGAAPALSSAEGDVKEGADRPAGENRHEGGSQGDVTSEAVLRVANSRAGGTSDAASDLRSEAKSRVYDGSGEMRDNASGEVASKPEQPSPTPQSDGDVTAAAPSLTLDWPAYIGAVKAKAAGAAVMLKSCDYTLAGDTLTIYAGKKFNKTKLDKTLPDLSAALTECGVTATIEVLASAKPPADETTANILAMMGGGEEVSAEI